MNIARRTELEVSYHVAQATRLTSRAVTLIAFFCACNLRVIDIKLNSFLLQPLHGPDLIFEKFPGKNGGGAP
jgi:hypothetical protein